VTTVEDLRPQTVPDPGVTTRAERETDQYDHLAPLLAEYAALAPDDPRRADLRDSLVRGYLPVVHHIAGRYRNRGEPVDDLDQVGSIGLIHALDRFDPERGLHFLTYAVPTITGEIRRHFRDRTWSVRVPRTLKDLQQPLRDAVAKLSDDLGRAPRPSEIAAELGAPLEQVIEALRAQDAYSSASLDTPVGASGGTLGDSLGDTDSALEKVEYRHLLKPLLDELPERERTIVVLRFFEEMTQTQIAARVGLSQMHVSRLLAQTLTRLRGRIEAGQRADSERPHRG
jgi:RNA polymerase sigma-B factor